MLHGRADVPKRKEGNDVEGDLAKFAEAFNATVVVFEAIGGKQTQVIKVCNKEKGLQLFIYAIVLTRTILTASTSPMF